MSCYSNNSGEPTKSHGSLKRTSRGAEYNPHVESGVPSEYGTTIMNGDCCSFGVLYGFMVGMFRARAEVGFGA